MKTIVLEKTKYILNNSWLGLLMPTGVHQLLLLAERNTGGREKSGINYRLHPAESKISLRGNTMPPQVRP